MGDKCAFYQSQPSLDIESLRQDVLIRSGLDIRQSFYHTLTFHRDLIRANNFYRPWLCSLQSWVSDYLYTGSSFAVSGYRAISLLDSATRFLDLRLFLHRIPFCSLHTRLTSFMMYQLHSFLSLIPQSRRVSGNIYLFSGQKVGLLAG